jgi:hypothetical protein
MRVRLFHTRIWVHSLNTSSGIATGIPLQYLSVGGEFTTALLDTTNFLNGLIDLPTVITNSWGVAEDGFGASLATSVFESLPHVARRLIPDTFLSEDPFATDTWPWAHAAYR